MRQAYDYWQDQPGNFVVGRGANPKTSTTGKEDRANCLPTTGREVCVDKVKMEETWINQDSTLWLSRHVSLHHPSHKATAAEGFTAHHAAFRRGMLDASKY